MGSDADAAESCDALLAFEDEQETLVWYGLRDEIFYEYGGVTGGFKSINLPISFESSNEKGQESYAGRHISTP